MPDTHLLKKCTAACKNEFLLTQSHQAHTRHLLSPSFVPSTAGHGKCPSASNAQKPESAAYEGGRQGGRKPVLGQSEGQLPARETSWRNWHWSWALDEGLDSSRWTKGPKTKGTVWIKAKAVLFSMPVQGPHSEQHWFQGMAQKWLGARHPDKKKPTSQGGSQPMCQHPSLSECRWQLFGAGDEEEDQRWVWV